MEYNTFIHKCKDLWQVDEFVYSGRMLTKDKELDGEFQNMQMLMQSLWVICDLCKE